MGVAAQIAIPIVTFVLGSLITWRLHGKSAAHARKVAIFDVEIEELKEQHDIIRDAINVLVGCHLLQSSRVEGNRLVSEDRLLTAYDEALAVQRRLSTSFITAPVEFNVKWTEFYIKFSRPLWLLMQDRTVLPEELTPAMEEFMKASGELEPNRTHWRSQLQGRQAGVFTGHIKHCEDVVRAQGAASTNRMASYQEKGLTGLA